MKAVSSEIIRHLYNGPKFTIDDIFDLFKKEERGDIELL